MEKYYKLQTILVNFENITYYMDENVTFMEKYY